MGRAAENDPNSKTIRFEDELLPKWAQMLDVAARLTPLPEKTKRWFADFTRASGVDDARTIVEECGLLRAALEQRSEDIIRELSDARAGKILEAWKYTLETMIQEARGKQTCAWTVEGGEESTGDNEGEGDISLRRS